MTRGNWTILRVVYTRTWSKTLRRPVVLIFSFVQPMMWMLFFGFLFHRYALDSIGEGISYLDFLVPGVCAMTVLFGASQSGISLIFDMRSQFFSRMLSTPADARLILGGKVLADVSRLLAQAVVVCALGWLIGARMDVAFGPLLQAILALGLFAAAFCCISCLIAMTSQSQESMAVFIHVVNMPLLFTSSALVPAKQMPAWLETIARWNPLTLAVDICRNALLFGERLAFVGGLTILAILAILLFAIAARGMSRATHDK
jgi:ABC-2 type transport system permease protein